MAPNWGSQPNSIPRSFRDLALRAHAVCEGGAEAGHASKKWAGLGAHQAWEVALSSPQPVGSERSGHRAESHRSHVAGHDANYGSGCHARIPTRPAGGRRSGAPASLPVHTDARDNQCGGAEANRSHGPACVSTEAVPRRVDGWRRYRAGASVRYHILREHRRSEEVRGCGLRL
jgi:hypothetical protein